LDKEYLDKMEDVLKTYEKPFSEDEPVICVDEKPVVLHEDTRPPIPMQPGQIARRDYEYKRCGTANVFCGIEPKAGVHFTKVTPTRSSPEFADFLWGIAEHYPAAHTIHLVMDNLSTHTRKALVERFGEVDGGWLWERFTVHYTPKHGSWLNQAEIEIGLFSRQCPRKTQNRRYRHPAPPSQSLEPPRKPRPDHHQVDVHKKARTPETKLLIHAVTVLGCVH
jgi:hypothetical protein